MPANGKRPSNCATGQPRHPRVTIETIESFLAGSPPSLHTLPAAANVLDALRLMANQEVGAVLVVDGATLSGIFSERDFARISLAVDPSPSTLVLGAAMSKCPALAKPEDTLQHCLVLMEEHQVEYMPVLIDDIPIGLVSRSQLQQAVIAQYERVFRELELDWSLLFIQGVYSC